MLRVSNFFATWLICRYLGQRWPAGLPRAKRFADDRPPTVEEIRRIVEYPDRRIKPVVYMMASTGIRVDAWGYLKHRHIIPIEREGKVVAAKVWFTL